MSPEVFSGPARTSEYYKNLKAVLSFRFELPHLPNCSSKEKGGQAQERHHCCSFTCQRVEEEVANDVLTAASKLFYALPLKKFYTPPTFFRSFNNLPSITMPAVRTHDSATASLEVRTGMNAPTSPLPTLAIIAPTPRAFTFPASHNLNISPYSTPSNSPFEPDLNTPFELWSPASSYLSTPSPLTRNLSPDSSVSVSSPQSDSPDAERRPQKGDEGYIKRPENAFILFRRKWCEDRQQAEEELGIPSNRKKERQADLSKTISQKWKSLSKKDRQYWEDLAKEKKKVHREMYPNYVFRPQRVRDKDGHARNKKYTKRNRGPGRRVQRDPDGETAYVIPDRRFASASSTPPLTSYHTIRIPIIPLVSPRPDSLSSPFLPVPKVGQTFSGTVGNITPNLQSDSMLHSEAGLQSSELMRNLFNLPAPETPESTRSAAQLQPLSISPLSSVASSPVSGPFTPTSDLLDQPAFNNAQLYPYPLSTTGNCESADNAISQIPRPADIQAELGAQQDILHSYPSWQSHNAIWQAEPNTLAGNDFDLQIIPPIELGQGLTMQEYDDNAVFGIAPAATLNDFVVHDFAQEYFLPMDSPGDDIVTMSGDYAL
ncbi:hypothetical protein GGU10DRAFT_342370 [Lentinula aff. detonsa]|uniref:HMG box domain-containing protein n=1 Tax=Lentinula aff. detonsa TaxID=2804958 RepID=A0AA38TYV9_9AGAR|nr:hypothetical protein GGU10DRAFT_342370 [Lentinula aff. detonsa]